MDEIQDLRIRRRVLFVRPWNSTFIERDYQILRRSFDVGVVDFDFSKAKPLTSAMTLVKLLFGIFWADVSYSWFAGTHSYLAVMASRLLGKKSIVVIGGYEVASMPEIEFGGLLDSRFRRKLRFILDNATRILAVSQYSRGEIMNLTSRAGAVELIYNGVELPTACSYRKTPNLAITVGGVNREAVSRKGLECFVKSAAFAPDIRFVVIGAWLDESITYLRTISSPNVEFLGYLPRAELLEWYAKAKVYCQLSRHESFGVAVAEAMSYECVPVVTEYGALPEVVGDTGFVAPYGNPEQTAEVITLASKSNKGKEARERVVQHFLIEKRERELVTVILREMS